MYSHDLIIDALAEIREACADIIDCTHAGDHLTESENTAIRDIKEKVTQIEIAIFKRITDPC